METKLPDNIGTEFMETTVLIKKTIVLINYKRLYDECKRNLEEQMERFQKRITLANEHNEILHMRECCKKDYEKLLAEFKVLQVKYDELEADSEKKLAHHENNNDTAIVDKDKIVVVQREDIEACDENFSRFESSKNSKLEKEKLIEDYEKTINDKDEEIVSQKETASRLRNNTYISNTRLNKRNSECFEKQT